MEMTSEPTIESTTDASRLAALEPRDSSGLLPRRRPGLNRLAWLMLVLLLLAAGVLGGVELEKHYGASSGPTSGQRPAGFGGQGGGFAGAAGASAAAGAAGGAATAATGSTTGQVKLIKGSTIYVSDFFGNTVKVTIPPTATVTKSTATSTKGIHPGDTVSVQGSQQKDGSYSATTISVTPGG